MAESGTGVDCDVEELDDPPPVLWLDDVLDDVVELEPELESIVVGVVAARFVLLLVEVEERGVLVLAMDALVPLVLESAELGVEDESPWLEDGVSVDTVELAPTDVRPDVLWAAEEELELLEPWM
jgi:hypothetical protein